MSDGLLQVLVEEDFGYEKEGRNWGRAKEHSSLVVNEESQRWYWNSEEKGGDVLSYLIKVRGLNLKDAKEVVKIRGQFHNGFIIKNEENKIYGHPYEKLVDLFWDLGKGNRDYWYKRCLTDKTIDRYRLGFYDGWSLIPLYKGDAFTNFQCRRDIPEKRIKLWYKIEGWKHVLINPELLQLVDKIYITEGPVDAILLNQEGIPAISHTGGAGYWNVKWYTLFNKVKDIVYIMDNDDAGLAGAKKVAQGLGEMRVKILKYPFDKKGYDTVDFFRDGGTAEDVKKFSETETKYLFEIGELNENRSGHRRSHSTLAYKYV
jgi:DNA primase